MQLNVLSAAPALRQRLGPRFISGSSPCCTPKLPKLCCMPVLCICCQR